VASYTDPTTIVSTGKPDSIAPGIYIFLVGSILSAVLAAIFFFQSSTLANQVGEANARIAQKEQELASLKPTADELSNLTEEARGLHAIFDTQKRWPAVLGKVAERLHKQMTVTTLQVSSAGLMTLGGTVPDYLTYAKVYQAFTDTEGAKYFSAVKPVAVSKVEGAAGQPGYVSFTFSLTLLPPVLSAGGTNPVTAQ
jgi:hypothetical protein